MAKIIKAQVEKMPKVKFIGKKYTEKDMDKYGTFAEKWGEWFQTGRFDALKGKGGIEGISDDYIGLMHCTGNGFEYYIGMFMAENDPVPEGYDSVVLEAGNMFTCYIQGKDETGELYSEKTTGRCYEILKAAGYTTDERAWMFERYNCPRFTNPDENGCVVLDYCMYIKE